MNFIFENFDILKTCSFTGHRSQKLPWRFNENDKRCLAMKTILKNHIEELFTMAMILSFPEWHWDLI